MTKLVRVLLPLAAVLGLATSARAADPPPSDGAAQNGAAQKSTDADENEARRVFRRGQAHFNLNEYTQAAEDFESAYRLYPLPIFLYNVAQAQRLAGNDERALYFYRVYLRTDPKSKLKGEVQDRIATLEKQVAAKGGDASAHAQPRTAAAPPAPTTTPPTPANPPANLTTMPPPNPPTPTTAPPTIATAPSSPATTETPSNTLVAAPHEKPLYKKWWLWTIVGGVVVAGVVVGVAVGVTQKGPSGPPAINF